MEISLQKSNQLKSIAILMMLCLHLFNRPFEGLFQPLLFIGSQPLSYYVSLFCDACVPIFAFVSGYGLFYKYQQEPSNYIHSNKMRIRNLYINYWIVLFLFVVVLGTILSKVGYPGNFQTFLLNVTAIKVSYNGAWWFLTTYLLFVITSIFWYRLLVKQNPYLYFIVLVGLYGVGFYFRIYKSILFDQPLLQWLHTQTALYFCTLFQFLLGAFALQYRWNSKFSSFIVSMPNKNYFLIFGIILLVVVHGVLPNFFFAPFTALGFIFLYCQLTTALPLQKAIDFFTPHATNIWLIHMFFYMIYFKELIYKPKYVVPIFLWLLLWSVLGSIIVNKGKELLFKILK